MKSLSIKEKKINYFLVFLALVFIFLTLSDFRFGMILYLKIAMMLLFLGCAIYKYSDRLKKQLGIKKYLYLLVYIAGLYITYISYGGYVGGIWMVLPWMLSFFPVFIFDFFYMLNNRNNFKILYVVLLCIILFIAVKGILVSISQPDVMRVLAVGDDTKLSGYASLGIGGYGFAYSLPFIIPLMLVMIIKRVHEAKFTLFLCITVIVLTYALFIYQYTIAILIFLFLVLLLPILSKTGSRRGQNLWILLFVALLIFVIFNLEDISNLIFQFSYRNLSGYSTIQSRINEIATVMSGQSVTGDLEIRLSVYRQSLETFIQNPILGAGYKYGYNMGLGGVGQILGGHSSLLDNLGLYGILFVTPLILFFIEHFKSLGKRYPQRKSYVLICGISLLVLSIVNTILVGAVLMTVLLIIPIFLEEMDIKESEKQEKLND